MTQQDVSWEVFAGLALPVSRTHGPFRTPPGRASGFSHDDDGAALAAVHLLVRTFPFAGSDVFEPTIAEQVTGRDVAALRRLTASAYDELAPSAGVERGAPLVTTGAGSAGSVAGYRVDESGSRREGTDTVVVEVLIRQDGGETASVFTSYGVELTWRDDDWALVAPPWGDWRSSATPLRTADPNRYTPYDTIGSR